MAAGAAPGKWAMRVLALQAPQMGEWFSKILVDDSEAAVCERLLLM